MAAGLAPEDTAHNALLAIAVEGGIVALILAAGVVEMNVLSLFRTRGQVRITLATTLLVLVVSSLTATVEQTRTTWLLLALISLAGRLAEENSQALEICFSRAEREIAEAVSATA
jgi:hypothetical protein